MAGLVLASCGTEEPEDGTTTVASSVGMTSGATASGDTSTGAADEGSSSDDTGSAGSGGTVVDYETDVQPIWNATCSCHLMGGSGTMTAPFLTLNPGMSHGELVDVASEQAALDRIEPGSLEDSYLYLKLTGAHETIGSGMVMPQIGTLEDAQLAIIEAWILAGAES